MFRQGLVALQVAMAVILLVSATLLGRSLLRLHAVDPGFHVPSLLTARIELTGDAYADASARVRFLAEFVGDVRALPGVTNASLINYLPVLDPVANVPVWDADHPPVQPNGASIAFRRRVLPGYFATMGIPLVAGRDLSEGECMATDRPPVAVINQSLQRQLFANGPVIGRRVAIATGGPQPIVAEVVGVARDARVARLGTERSPALYVPYQAASSAAMRLVVRTTGEPTVVVAAVRAALTRRDRSQALAEVKTMATILADSLRGFGLRTGAVLLFGALAALLAMIGVYSVLAFMVEVRRSDIGLRLVVGASRARVLWWTVARGMAPVVVGLVFGLAGAAGAGQ